MVGKMTKKKVCSECGKPAKDKCHCGVLLCYDCMFFIGSNNKNWHLCKAENDKYPQPTFLKIKCKHHGLQKAVTERVGSGIICIKCWIELKYWYDREERRQKLKEKVKKVKKKKTRWFW